MEVWAFWLDQGLKAVITDSFEDRNNNSSLLMSMAVTSKIQWTKVCNCNTIVVLVTSRIFVCHSNNFHLCFRGWCWRAGIGCWIVMTTFLSFEQTETQRHEKLLSWIYKYQLQWLDPVLVIDNNPEICQSTRNDRKLSKGWVMKTKAGICFPTTMLRLATGSDDTFCLTKK